MVADGDRAFKGDGPSRGGRTARTPAEGRSLPWLSAGESAG